MTIPEAKRVYVCLECGKVFDTEKEYEKHFEMAHTNTVVNKYCLGKYFVERYKGYPISIHFPMSITANGNVRGNVWMCGRDGYNHGYSFINYSFNEEISKDDAKKIIEDWHRKNILESEKEYQENLKGMFEDDISRD